MGIVEVLIQVMTIFDRTDFQQWTPTRTRLKAYKLWRCVVIDLDRQHFRIPSATSLLDNSTSVGSLERDVPVRSIRQEGKLVRVVVSQPPSLYDCKLSRWGHK